MTRIELLEKIVGGELKVSDQLTFSTNEIESGAIRAYVNINDVTIVFVLWNHYDDVKSFSFYNNIDISNIIDTYKASLILAEYLGIEIPDMDKTVIIKEKIVEKQVSVIDQKSSGLIEAYEKILLNSGKKITIE